MISLLLLLVEPEQQEKFLALYGTYKHRIYNHAYSVLQDVHLAEDAVQETMLELIKYLDGIVFVDSPETASLVRLIARHKSIDHSIKRHRREKRDRFYYEQYVNDLDPAREFRQLEDTDNIDFLYRILDGLDGSHRDVVMLWSQGYSHNKISKILHISPTTSRKRLKRSIHLVRKMWGDCP